MKTEDDMKSNPHPIEKDCDDVAMDNSKVTSNDQGSIAPTVDKKAILRKLDVRIIPVLAVLYLMSFLDRANIGNARIEGMTEDLNISSQQFNLCRKRTLGYVWGL